MMAARQKPEDALTPNDRNPFGMSWQQEWDLNQDLIEINKSEEQMEQWANRVEAIDDTDAKLGNDDETTIKEKLQKLQRYRERIRLNERSQDMTQRLVKLNEMVNVKLEDKLEDKFKLKKIDRQFQKDLAENADHIVEEQDQNEDIERLKNAQNQYELNRIAPVKQKK